MPPVIQARPVDVKSLPPVDRFLYWIRERHSIYLKRERDQSAPWTKDPILQRYFFTNPYRENDKVTRWFQEKIRHPMRNDPGVIFATIAFRWFNYIPTGEILLRNNLLRRWDRDRCVDVLKDQVKIFTGAYMISSPAGSSKLNGICDRITVVWNGIDDLIEKIRGTGMQAAHSILTGVDGLGGFMAYEIVCDLRYTSMLNPVDRDEWCNPGPGAIRGMYRILGIPLPRSGNSSILPIPKNWEKETRNLLAVVRKRFSDMPPFEMREVEHSLCEWDKYERLLWGEGRSKRIYRPPQEEDQPESVQRILTTLRRPQIAILRALIESGGEQTRDEISRVSGVDRSKIGDYAGPRPENQTDKTRKRWPFPTLIDLGLVMATRCDNQGFEHFLYRASEKSKSLFRR